MRLRVSDDGSEARQYSAVTKQCLSDESNAMERPG